MVENQILIAVTPDPERFAFARAAAAQTHERYNIGTYRERSQHLIFKRYFEPDTSKHEVPLCGYVADIFGDAGVIEIQTSGFGALRGKLEVFLQDHKVTLVYPRALKKRVIWTDPETGESFVGVYRRDPRARYAVLAEMLYIAAFFPHPNLQVLNVLTAASDHKLLDGYGKERKKRATKKDTVPEELLEIVPLRSAEDVRRLLPLSSGDQITREALGKLFGVGGRRLWNMIRFLEEIGILTRSGKEGKKIIYTVVESDGSNDFATNAEKQQAGQSK